MSTPERRRTVGQVVRPVPRTVGPPVRSSWDDVDQSATPTTLDDLDDVEVESGDVGVLTRATPGAVARFEPLPEPVRPRRHTQGPAADRWQIVHNLGYRPGFVVHDGAGRLHMPENVEHPVPGVVSEIVFGMPMVGTADPT